MTWKRYKRAKPRDEAKIGDYYAPCCLHDLYPITTEEERIDALDGQPHAGVWGSLEDAVSDLLDEDHRTMSQSYFLKELQYAVDTYGVDAVSLAYRTALELSKGF